MRLLLILCFPVAAFAQSAPVADAFRVNVKRVAKRLMLSAEEMPESKYGYKPTAGQMTFGEVVWHLAEENDVLCGAIGGTSAPKRSTMAATDTKAHLVARLEETFAYCDRAFASLDDRRLGQNIEGQSLALVLINAVGHYADHYSQAAIYLRLNGLLPPTAKDPSL
ncbi:MAG TPA: DinB family protein [Gemmatimonadaceae bacterium]|nr:DinB family protein [Gemmatimonadaceae bacterium]